MYRTLTILLLVALSLCTHAEGQPKPDLNGVWKLNVAKSDYGDMPGPSSRTDIIEQRGEDISESVVSLTRNKIQRYTMFFSTDGRRTVLSPREQVDTGFVTLKSISATWQGSSLVVIQVLGFDEVDLLAKNTYSLSADGSTLTILISLGGEGIAAKYVFDRVPS